MRVLFAASVTSVHTARWISQLADQGWDLHVFDFVSNYINEELRDVTVHLPTRQRPSEPSQRVRSPWPLERGAGPVGRRLPKQLRAVLTPERTSHLARLIQELQPDVVHVLEMQHYGYPLLEVATGLGGRLPAPLAFSSWGNDLYWFRRFPADAERISRVLPLCDFYIADCDRDVPIAREMGFTGEVLGVFPVAGGLPVDRIRALAIDPPSRRSTIAVKGYENYAGRALGALDALAELGPELLSNYTVELYSAGPAVAQRVSQLDAMGIAARVLPRLSREEVWQLMAQSRVALALAVTDGIPMALLEAMSAGAYPIQSDTISTAEVISPANGALVDCHDLTTVASALESALTDDVKVDKAAEVNAGNVRRFDEATIRPQVVSAYHRIANRD